MGHEATNECAYFTLHGSLSIAASYLLLMDNLSISDEAPESKGHTSDAISVVIKLLLSS